MEEELKVCRECHLELPITRFSFATKAKTTRRGKCLSCDAARVRKFYAENAEYRQKTKERGRIYDLQNPVQATTRQWKCSIRANYGITPFQYSQLVIAQGGKCALCKSPEIGRTGLSGKWSAGRWNIDHCHLTQKVRGLLCHTCNVRLGAYERLMSQVGEDAVLDYITRPSPLLALPQAPLPVPRPVPRYFEVLPEKEQPQCNVEGCSAVCSAQKLCQKHYARFLRTGNVGPAENLPRATMQGTRHVNSKLTDDNVRFILASKETGVVLAERFSVTAALISNVRRRKTWTHVGNA